MRRVLVGGNRMTTLDAGARRLLWWNTLSREEQVSAIRRLSAGGMSDHDIAGATKLSVEAIRQVIGRPQCEACEE
jgi:hypothetical protein